MNHIKLSWVTALIATMGSLFLSLVLHFVPCELCWYQRILMYPIVIILGVAIVRNDVKAAFYVLPMSILGMLFGAYHYIIQKFDFGKAIAQCTGGVSCTNKQFELLGFITIPFMSFVAFTIITVTLVLSVRKMKKEQA